jgi:hypothetical protein
MRLQEIQRPNPPRQDSIRPVVVGLALISLMMGGSAFAGDAPNTDSAGSQEVRKPSPTAQSRADKKRASAAHADGSSAPRSLPLSSAETYAAEHSASMPITSVPKPAASPGNASSPGNSWTGFYVGAGAGVGTAQP